MVLPALLKYCYLLSCLFYLWRNKDFNLTINYYSYGPLSWSCFVVVLNNSGRVRVCLRVCVQMTTFERNDI